MGCHKNEFVFKIILDSSFCHYLISYFPFGGVGGLGGRYVLVWVYHPIPQGFSRVLLKPYIKAVTQFFEVEWWRTFMVECVTVLTN